MNDTRKRSGRVQFLLIALVFLGPVVIAAWMYFGDGLAPEGRSNHGELLEPIVNIGEALPDSPVVPLYDNSWLLVYADAGSCEESCRERLYTQRQARLMLGREMDRLARVFLHGDTPPDTVFLAAEHPGLIALTDADVFDLLNDRRPAARPAGGFYLVDPLGNLVMYFEPDMDPYGMVDDIKRLLKLSRIG